MKEDSFLRRVTCKEAVRLLIENKVTKIWFRPDGILKHSNPDDDIAYIWLKGEENEPSNQDVEE